MVEFGTGTMLVAFERALHYFFVIGPALAFGILISAGVRAFVQPELLDRVLGGRGIRGQLKAAMAGAPLMLCSCCVAPVFNTAYERGLRLGSSITLMLASPSLNPASLVLTFILFPPKLAFARFCMAILAVTCSGPFIERLFPRACAFPVPVDDASAENGERQGVRAGGRRFVRSVGYVVLRTVPALAVGAVGSMILVQFVPPALWSSGTLRILAVIATATVAVPLALPTFFEIPLALGLIAAGGPAGAAAALLFAGPAVNLPSLLTLAKTTHWKAALSLALLIWTIAVAGGLLVG
ncbi:MAG TPA: permease [Gammaproteobacteria bacterium]|nr:permease [Gammaproteobacteria bacterium]